MWKALVIIGVQERTSFASTELEISFKQICLVFGNSTSSERARTRAKRRVSGQQDIVLRDLESNQVSQSDSVYDVAPVLALIADFLK